MFIKTYKLLLITITFVIATILSSCVNGTEEPEINIRSGSEELKPIYYGDINNQAQEEIEERLKDFMIGKRFSDLPTIAYGSKIQIEALNFETKEVEVYGYVIDEKANIISDYAVKPLTILPVEDGLAEFIWEANDHFDRHQDYTIEGKLIHGILIRCEIDGNPFAFSTLLLGES